MLKLYVSLKNLLRREEGQDVIEYALVTAVVSVGIIALVVATGLLGAFTTWGNGIAAEINGAFD
jgi:Flp pilus assembly pilin Flp